MPRSCDTYLDCLLRAARWRADRNRSTLVKASKGPAGGDVNSFTPSQGDARVVTPPSGEERNPWRYKGSPPSPPLSMVYGFMAR